jgi:large subunit ribosomal protein L3
MKCLLGKKLGMKQVYAPDGSVRAVTAIQAGPCSVVQVKELEKDGYTAVQLGYGEKKHVNKSLQGHFKGIRTFGKNDSGFLHVREARVSSVNGILRGAIVDVASFQQGEKIQVIGTSRGKGFAGVVKRHHFHGHPTSHGHKDQERMPGSIGSGGVQHVLKGLRMAGRMGTDRVTVTGLEIIEIDQESNILYVSGAVPGARNGLVMVQADGDANYRVPQEAGEPQADQVEAVPEPLIETEPTPSQIKEVEEAIHPKHSTGEEGIGLSTDEIIEQAQENPISPQAEAQEEDNFPASQDEPTNVDDATGEVKT